MVKSLSLLHLSQMNLLDGWKNPICSLFYFPSKCPTIMSRNSHNVLESWIFCYRFRVQWILWKPTDGRVEFLLNIHLVRLMSHLFQPQMKYFALMNCATMSLFGGSMWIKMNSEKILKGSLAPSHSLNTNILLSLETHCIWWSTISSPF